MEVYEVKIFFNSPVMERLEPVEHRLLANSEEDAINKVNEILKDDGFKIYTTKEIKGAILLSKEEQEKWYKINPEQREKKQ